MAKMVKYYASSSSRVNTARAGPDKRWSLMGLPEVGVQGYYQRLIDHHLIPDPQANQDSSSLSLRPRCPVCSHRLMACSSCSIVTCGAHPRCVGGRLVPMLCCCTYDKMMFCFDCLGEDYSGLLSECVLCEARSCSRLMTKFTTPMWKNCSERNWGPREHDDQGVCLDCTESIRGHVACPCGLAWVCGVCAQKKIQMSGRRCPRCQTFYCFDGCKYINTCTGCQKTILCNDCMEEEMSDEEGSLHAKKGVVLVATCGECRLGICEDCSEDYEFRCESCDRVHCRDCMGDEEYCSCCGTRMCPMCTEIGCEKCEGSSESSD
ncbi:hypothetical protein DFH29DRAFT_925270 [Suillus ampliporus]|nr:hypothetical protein DFH29DRAFT_925270 [Suillus ampliporus]